jgi:dihydrofolate reductase
MILSLIVAMSRNRVIGRDNRLPWHLPEDLKRFRKITTGHPVIMGRKTFESIGRLLPNRENIILTRQPEYRVLGAKIVASLDEALSHCHQSNPEQEVFILGGAEVYRQALPLVQRLYLTCIEQDVEGDATFPLFNWSDYKVIEEENRTDPLPFRFVTLERIS